MYINVHVYMYVQYYLVHIRTGAHNAYMKTYIDG